MTTVTEKAFFIHVRDTPKRTKNALKSSQSYTKTRRSELTLLVTQIWSQEMNTIREELQEQYRIEFHGEQYIHRQEAVKQVLLKHKYAYSHFITLHPSRLIDISESFQLRDALINALPGRYRNTNARFIAFHSVSNLNNRLVQQIKDREFWRRSRLMSDANAHIDETPLIAPFHIHALVGSMNTATSNETITQTIQWECMKSCSAQVNVHIRQYDHSDQLIHYITDSKRGNYIEGLQETNDEFICSQLIKSAITINWCPPKRNKGISQ
jgi:hypothetical protein